MQMTCSNTLAILVKEFDCDDLFGIGRIIARFVKLRALDLGLLDSRVLYKSQRKDLDHGVSLTRFSSVSQYSLTVFPSDATEKDSGVTLPT
jgi:hypothetical protein